MFFVIISPSFIVTNLTQSPIFVQDRELDPEQGEGMFTKDWEPFALRPGSFRKFYWPDSELVNFELGAIGGYGAENSHVYWSGTNPSLLQQPEGAQQREPEQKLSSKTVICSIRNKGALSEVERGLRWRCLFSKGKKLAPKTPSFSVQSHKLSVGHAQTGTDLVAVEPVWQITNATLSSLALKKASESSWFHLRVGESISYYNQIESSSSGISPWAVQLPYEDLLFQIGILAFPRHQSMESQSSPSSPAALPPPPIPDEFVSDSSSESEDREEGEEGEEGSRKDKGKIFHLGGDSEESETPREQRAEWKNIDWEAINSQQLPHIFFPSFSAGETPPSASFSPLFPSKPIPLSAVRIQEAEEAEQLSRSPSSPNSFLSFPVTKKDLNRAFSKELPHSTMPKFWCEPSRSPSSYFPAKEVLFLDNRELGAASWSFPFSFRHCFEGSSNTLDLKPLSNSRAKK